jgi:hypothetical protein
MAAICCTLTKAAFVFVSFSALPMRNNNGFYRHWGRQHAERIISGRVSSLIGKLSTFGLRMLVSADPFFPPSWV